MSFDVEDILLSRRSVSGCTEEVWRRRQEEEKKKKAEEVANRISTLMIQAEECVSTLIEKLRQARQTEASVKSQLLAIGVPFAYAESGLNGEKIDITKVAPLVVAMGENLEDFGLDNAPLEVPEDFKSK